MKACQFGDIDSQQTGLSLGVISGALFQAIDRVEITHIELLAANTTQHLTFVRLSSSSPFQGSFTIRAYQILFIAWFLRFACHGTSAW